MPRPLRTIRDTRASHNGITGGAFAIASPPLFHPGGDRWRPTLAPYLVTDRQTTTTGTGYVRNGYCGYCGAYLYIVVRSGHGQCLPVDGVGEAQFRVLFDPNASAGDVHQRN